MIHDPVVDEIIGASIKIHRALGPGLLESSYEHCLEYELRKRRLAVQRQVPVPLIYEEVKLDCGYRVADADLSPADRCQTRPADELQLRDFETGTEELPGAREI